MGQSRKWEMALVITILGMVCVITSLVGMLFFNIIFTLGAS